MGQEDIIVTSVNEAKLIDGNGGTEINVPQQEKHDASPRIKEDPQEYIPDFKYKVYDQEKEFPEFIRPVVKSKDLEEKFRDILTRADGLEGIKEKHQRTLKERDELLPIRTQYEELLAGVNQLRDYADKDLDLFLQAYNIPEDKLFKYVTDRLKVSELGDEEKRMLADARTAKFQNVELENRLRRTEAQTQAMLKQQHEIQFSSELSRPEVSDFAKRYNDVYGPDAFKTDVIAHGAFVYNTSKRDLTPSEAIMAVMQKHKPAFERFMTSAPVDQTPPPKPIPNVGGQGARVTPTKQRFKSIDDIKKHFQQTYEGR